MPARRAFRIYSIGTVRRDIPAIPEPGEFFDPWQETTLEIDERWAAGLDGIEQFSHLVVLFYLDRAQRRRVAGPPRAAEGRDDAPTVGFFATRTPKRPNPIGIACPRLLRRDGNRLIVAGIDAWPGSPIIDVKGYYPRDECRTEATVPDWLAALWDSHDAARGLHGESREGVADRSGR